MPTRPQKSVLQNSPEQLSAVLNRIRSEASPQYQNMVPELTPQTPYDVLHGIGTVMYKYEPVANELVSALLNRIAITLVRSAQFYDPWGVFDMGTLDYGETVYEVFTKLAKPMEYDPEGAPVNELKSTPPEALSTFHYMNYTKVYPETISNEQLKLAFVSWNGLYDFIARIIEQMFVASQYDIYQTKKYLLAKTIKDGMVPTIQVPQADTTDNIKSIIATIQEASSNLEFLPSRYNIAGVPTNTRKEDQFVILNTGFDARANVDVLAAAYHMDRAEFMGTHRLLVDGFGNLDNERLALLFAEDPTYEEIDDATQKLLNSIPAVVVSRRFLISFINFDGFTQTYLGSSLRWNYWYHVWRTFGISPYENMIAFNPNEQSVVTVTVSPATASATAGQIVQLSATVVTTGFASKALVWTTSDNTIATVDQTGKVTALKAGTVTITATSDFDNTKTGTSTITIA